MPIVSEVPTLSFQVFIFVCVVAVFVSVLTHSVLYDLEEEREGK